MKNYKHLFFDLDGTLWDLRLNTRVTLEQLFEKYHTQLNDIHFDHFFARYHHHNDHVWALYRDGKMDKETLRYVRFERAMHDVGIDADQQFVRSFSEDFMDICPKQPHTLEGAHDVLDYCSGKYQMHIITNGFIEVQGHKMNAAKLNGYFEHMINSEHCGVRKPHAGIFEYAMKMSGATPQESLMIGDDWVADIIGARDYGMDQAFLTTTEDLLNEMQIGEGHHPLRHNYKPTYTISSLTELKKYL